MKMTVEQQMQKILAECMEGVEEGTDEAAKAAATAAMKRLKRVSPKSKKRGKHYRAGWRVKRDRQMMYTVHNATSYQLTHLLNNGHVIKNQAGEYGRTQGDNHIGETADWAAEEFVKEAVKKI